MGEQSSILTIGIIGTPGCGKTTLCQELDLPVISLLEFAKKHDCLGEIESDGAAAIDVDELAKHWQQPSKLSLVDSHLAHHMPVDALIVIRCEPKELKSRLEARGYPAKKVQQNVEVEMMGGPWNELIGDRRPIYEGVEGVSEWINSGCPAHSTPETAADWLSKP